MYNKTTNKMNTSILNIVTYTMTSYIFRPNLWPSSGR